MAVRALYWHEGYWDLTRRVYRREGDSNRL